MIQPPAGMSGTSNSPITVRALNDGAALIDGQFARIPVMLNGNDWFVLEGFNAKNGTYAVINIASGSDYNIVRRVVAWDASIADNNNVIGIHGSVGNLFEDLAAFGTARKIFSQSQGGDSTTCRRCWIRWEGSTDLGPQAMSTMYNSYDFLGENVLVTWSGESQPDGYDATSNGSRTGSHPTNGLPSAPGEPLATDHIDYTNKCVNVRLLGSLVYIKPSDRFPSVAAIRINESSCYSIQNTMAYISPSNPSFNSSYGFLLERASWGMPSNVTADRITSVRGAKGDSFDGASSVTNDSRATSLSSVANPWSTTGAGANLCYRSQNGTATKTPLWPWPMNQRIKDATASAGAYAGPCPNCSGGRAARTATDVTAQVETLFGAMPSYCKGN